MIKICILYEPSEQRKPAGYRHPYLFVLYLQLACNGHSQLIVNGVLFVVLDLYRGNELHALCLECNYYCYIVVKGGPHEKSLFPMIICTFTWHL